MSERITSSQNSSNILLSYFESHKNALHNEVFVSLQKYRDLYFSYGKKHALIKTLDESLFKYRQCSNPLQKLKKLDVMEQLICEYREIYALILKLIEIESQSNIQDILKQNGCVDDIISEVKDRCYLEGGSYLDRRNLF